MERVIYEINYLRSAFMKELERKPNNLTKMPNPLYARGGDIFMAELGEGAKPMGVDEATRRIEIAAKVGEQAREQASARRFLEEHRESLPVDIRRSLEEITGQGGTPPPQPAEAGVPPGGREPPAPPPIFPETPPEGPEPQGGANESGHPGEVARQTAAGRQGERSNNRDIFANIEAIPTGEAELLERARSELEEDLEPITDLIERQQIIGERVESLRRLGRIREQIERSASLGMEDLEKAFDQINSAVAQREVYPVSAQPYLTELARRAAQFRERLREERTPEQTLEANRISSLPHGLEKTDELKKMIDTLDPDETISGSLLGLIAQDDEASEKFVDKVISKPFATPDADYRLSFYAEINLQSFLTKVRNIPDQTVRYEKYSAQRETALRLHEMNRATASQSGNIEGFLNISRTVTPEHLQAGVEIDGVEQARQILDLSFARMYAGNRRLTQDLYEPEILKWAERTFEAKVRIGIIKSSFKGADGNPRNLEEWESKRAFALARNFQTSFYRTAELISWGNVLEAPENWLQSMPAETIVRVLAHLKMLDRRMRVGGTRGGPEYTTLLFDDMKREYDGRGGSLKKIGQLDIRTDLLPVGFAPTGGFDKGWRTVIDYLGSDLMKINISDLANNLPAGETRNWLTKFIVERNRGNEESTNFGEFFANTAVFANMANGQDIKVEGIQIPKELLPADNRAAQKAMEDLLLPLLGITPKSDRIEEIAKSEYKFNMADFNYDPNQDQINFSLGVLMNAGVSDKVKTILWTKAAEVLPLRLAYFLAEEGIKGVDGYGVVKGEGVHLFSGDFENKLIALQLIRLREQKRIFLEQEEGIRRHKALPLSNYFAEAGLDTQEQEFVRALQSFEKSKAADLAKVSFPQVPFLDDVPFQNASYIKLGAEVFPRRMGSDFRAYSESGNAVTQIVNNLGQPYEEIEKHITAASEALSGPEGIKTGQDQAFKLYKTYFRLAKQWSWTKIPGVKTISSFLNKPTSYLQAKFGPNAESWDARMLSLRSREAAEKGNIRFEKLPGETKSQMKDLLDVMKAGPFSVFLSETISALLIYFLYSSISFGKETVSEKK